MDEPALIQSALSGDRQAFDELVRDELPRLRSFVLRFVADPDGTEDIVQEALLKAFEKLSMFRGEARFKTWLFAIARSICLNHLRSRKRWPVSAQIECHELSETSEAFKAGMGRAMTGPEFRFELAEHVAFCLTCVGRSLPPDESAALLLREMLGFSNREAADVLEVSESVLRHKLSAARTFMQESFEGLCALVAKEGACQQCRMLRDLCPGDRQGPQLDRFHHGGEAWPVELPERLRMAQEADLETGGTSGVHREMLRFLCQNMD